MNLPARMLGVVALASAMGCGNSTGGNPDAGTDGGTDGGSGPFTYTATFSGAVSGTVPVTVSFQYATSIGVPFTGASYALYIYVLGQLSSDFNAPSFGCVGTLPGTSLQPGSYSAIAWETPCELGAVPDGGTFQFFWQDVSFAVLNLESPGPETTAYTTERVWAQPTGSLTLVFAPLQPGLGPSPDGGVDFNVLFGPSLE